ncbi:tRNA dihydrouridine synthase DusB [Gemmobacter caeruleus]|uniref:tRNA dihydrouridine synthase DusB n=1 Tax=Gemmobacter caeruleus TaxID=2595004 RepID=UPI0011EBBFF4|nr:tRNA dihydrouridine synthase DusB [Gemmobacter caeruleus]
MALRLAEIALDPPVLLAPLAGITDLPFRRLVASFGAGLVVSEMVASQEVVQARPLARARAELGFEEAATSVQLAGRDPYWMAEAAKYVAGQGARVIDINMGCPAKKVTNGYSGSALMKDLDHALTLIEAVVGAVEVPVTLKTRLGWDDALMNAPELARRAEGAGVRMVTIHGRTRCQFYKGQADWGAIASVRQAITVPLIANGDITGPDSAAEALRLSGADGVMIGRGAQGRPWLLAQVAAALFGRPAPVVPQGDALADMIVGHHQAMLSFYGLDLGIRIARKHLGWYLEMAGLEAARAELMATNSPDRVAALVRAAFRHQERAAA